RLGALTAGYESARDHDPANVVVAISLAHFRAASTELPEIARSPVTCGSGAGHATLERTMAPHVLVADDDAWILRMVATVLEKRGYSVETAVDGEDALARALARTPDLLITDVMMPKMDGWALVRQLRSHPELAMMPVIFLTALSSEDDRIRGFRLGADDYVTKPFRFEELDLRVAKTLRRAAQTVLDTRDQLSGSGLRGDLSQVGLSSLLVLIEMERK